MCAAEAAACPLSTAEARRLFDPLAHASAIVLAVSGGPDSTALLMLAARWRDAPSKKKRPLLFAATVDHGLRPQSAHEARQVKRLARMLGVPHRTLRWGGTKPRTGLQQAARAARYRLLGDFARAVKADHILTAHTLDDQAETVLMRMSRGSGISGLGAMRKVSPLPVSCSAAGGTNVVLVRPLLDLPKVRLLATLDRGGIKYVEDASNRDARFARARLREVMPVLAREGLDAPRLALLARRLARADLALERAVESAAGDVLVRAMTSHNMAAHRQATCDSCTPEAMMLDGKKFFALPEEIGLRLLGRAIARVGDGGPPRLGKLEALYEALLASTISAPHPDPLPMKNGERERTPSPRNGIPATPASRGEGRGEGRGGRVRLRRTLAGALVTSRGSTLVVERAPRRSLRRMPHNQRLDHGDGHRAQAAK